MPSWIGVPLVVLGCASSALGFALMKRSGEVEVGVPPCLAWRWLLGFGCLAVVQTACDAASLSMLPLAVVAPFAGLTIVFSLALAASGALSDERERLSARDIAGAAAVLVGVTGVSLAAPQPKAEPTLAQAQAGLAAPVFAVPAAAAIVGAACCLLSSRSGPRGRCGCRPSPLLAAVGAASCGALSQLSIKVVSLSVRAAAATGSADLTTALVAWAHIPAALAALAVLAMAAPSQLALLQLALSARATVVVPLYQAYARDDLTWLES
jgi:hypothetical protein